MFAIETYPGANSKGTAITCDIAFESAGAFNADCSSYHTGQSGAESGPVTGQITMATACDFTGSITIPGDSKVTIRDGHINGNIGSGIATQASATKTRVLLFNLLKK